MFREGFEFRVYGLGFKCMGGFWNYEAPRCTRGICFQGAGGRIRRRKKGVKAGYRVLLEKEQEAKGAYREKERRANCVYARSNSGPKKLEGEGQGTTSAQRGV